MKISRIKFNLALACQHMSLTDLSEISGVSKVRLSDIKTGKAGAVRPATIGKIADGLGVPVSEIIETEV